MWFMIHIFRGLNDEAKIRQAIDSIRRHVDIGWDPEYGGLFLSVDAEGRDPWWDFADAKLWWPHTETLYALLLAYEIGREQWALDWFERIHNYSFSHFPVAGYGEWTQKLDRSGKKFSQTVALPVKDPFHLPRSLIYCIDVLKRLSDQ
jgi:N-acylglucosamine 2-epimerase